MGNSAVLRGHWGTNKITLDGEKITYKDTVISAHGAHAELSETRSGLGGRHHTLELVITAPDGEIAWSDTATGKGTGGYASQRKKALRFAAAVNTASVAG